MTPDGRRPVVPKRLDGDDNTDVAVELPIYPDRASNERTVTSTSDVLAIPPSPSSDQVPVPTPTRTGLIATSFSLEKGTNLGEYVIDSPIGEGGMGVVFAATHPMIGKRAAIKVLKPDLCEDQLSVERFIDEARVVNQIGHPNIVDIFAFGEMPDGRRYFVMEWLKGETLRQRLQRGRLSLMEVCTFVRQLARALEAAHEKGIIHRDLKPENVFLVDVRDDMPQVKLLDFGVAKLNSDAHRLYKTGAGELVGTPMYMSPEQARGGDGVRAEADIYSLGAIAFEMLCGRPPFQAKNTFEMVTLHLAEPPPVPSSLQPDIPEEVDQLLLAMLAKSPEERPSLHDVRGVLDVVNPGFTPLPRGSPLRASTALPGPPSVAVFASASSPAVPSFPVSAPVSVPLAVAPDPSASIATIAPRRGIGIFIVVGIAGTVGVAALVFMLLRSSEAASQQPQEPEHPAPVEQPVAAPTPPPTEHVEAPATAPPPTEQHVEAPHPPPAPPPPVVDHPRHVVAPHEPAPKSAHVVLTLKGSGTFKIDNKPVTGSRVDTQMTLGHHSIEYQGPTGAWHKTLDVQGKSVTQSFEAPPPPHEEFKKPPHEDTKKPLADDGLMTPGSIKKNP